MKVKVVHPASKGMRPSVNIEDKETGTDVAQTVLNYLHDECEQGNVSNYIIPEEPEEEEEEEDSQNSDQVTPKVDPVTTNQPKPKSVEVKLQQLQSTGSSSSSVLQRSLEIGLEYKVYLVSCESPHSFFVQLASDTEALEEISAALESAYESRDTSELVLPRPPSVGEYVCSQFSEDMKWYRARVLGFDPTDPAKVELLFIDYGNREMGEVADLRILSPSLPPHPPLALECFLAGVEPSEGQGSFSGDSTELMLELAGHGETVCKIEVQFADSAGHYGVNLSGGEGVNVAQSLIDANLASALQDTPTTAASNSEATPDQLQSGALQPDQPELPLSTEEPLAVTEKIGENLSDRFPTSYPAVSLQQGSTHNAVITSITSLDEFQCQLTDQIEQLEQLMEQIASRGYQIGDDDLAVTQPCKGLAVCACFTDEDVWYRAKITHVLSEGRVRVTYSDYGNSEEVELSRVKRLEKEFAESFPPLIVTCSLVPLTDRDIDPSRPPSQEAWPLEWPKKCLTQFQEMIGEEGEVRLVVVEEEEGGSGEGEEGRGVRVRVFVSREEGEIDVQKTLVEDFLDFQKSGGEVLQATDEADGGYGDSVTEEGGEGEGEGGAFPEISEDTSGTPEDQGASKLQSTRVQDKAAEGGKTSEGSTGSFEERLEEMVKEVATLAIAEAQQDLKISSEGDAPSINRED